MNCFYLEKKLENTKYNISRSTFGHNIALFIRCMNSLKSEHLHAFLACVTYPKLLHFNKQRDVVRY